jgi:plasmid stabilization system protein ParE
MTRYEELSAADRARQIEYLGRFGDEQVRRIARRLKTDLARAA